MSSTPQVSWRGRQGVCRFREPNAPLARRSTHAEASTSGHNEPSVHSRGKAVVVGAGPAGSLIAVYLAQQNYDVEVYEQRAMPDPMNRNLDRSYHLAMSHRGMGAVEKVGIDMSRFREFPYVGSLLQKQDGSTTKWFHTPVDSKVLVERMELVRHIVDEARRISPHRIKFIWEHNCQAVDMEQRTATFECPDGSSVDASFDVLIGADGVNSKVRQELQRQVPDFGVEWHGRMHRIDKFYHHAKPDAPIGFPGAELDANATVLRFFYVDSPPPLSVGLFFIHNHKDGSYSGGLGFTRADYSDAGSGGNFRSADDYAKVLRGIRALPEDMVHKIAEQFVERPWYSSGSTLQTSRLHQGRVLLVGDAAHAVSAAFGQGVNSALEDCKVFGEVLGGDPGDLDAVLAKFERQRYPDTRALGDMDRQGEAFQGFRGKWNLSYLLYQSHIRTAKRRERKVVYKGEVPSSLTVGSLLESGQAIARYKLGSFHHSAVFELVHGHLQMLLPSMYEQSLTEVRSEGGEKFV
ncbi:hypothetical protein WJX72_011767 [[Myrmecia] bisecta]|uniref:FAD-binding domain-containing protein n=1 Tax=[Myrmecia] bisecta TaxID=41462 RepID=A0AAW1RAV9_9CHLO